MKTASRTSHRGHPHAFLGAGAAIVFGVTLVLSWATSAALRRLPLGSLRRGAIAKGPLERHESHVVDF
jgi:hypothetical protein